MKEPLQYPSIELMNDVPKLREVMFAELEKAKQRHHAFMSEPNPTFLAREQADQEGKYFGELWGYLSHLNNMNYKEEWNQLLQEISEAYQEFFGPTSLDRQYMEQNKRLLDDPTATKYERRSVQEFIDEFEKSGGNLPQSKKDKLVKYEIELDKLSNEYGANLQKFKKSTYIDLTSAELSGVPAHIISSLEIISNDDGKTVYRLPAQGGLVSAVLEYATKQATRKKVYKMTYPCGHKGESNNIGIANKIVKLRRKCAKLIGASSVADETLEKRMAKNGQNVIDFITPIVTKAYPLAQKERQEMLDFCAKEGLDYEKPWNRSYASRIYCEKVLNYDDEAVRAYFPLNLVHDALFGWIKEFYGVSIEPYDETALWHVDARAWVWKNEDGSIIGYTTEDLFERAGKTGGAYHSGYQSYDVTRIETQWPESHVVANFRKDANGTYLSLGEIETLWHEYGHALHHMLTTIPDSGFNGTSVAWDTVELPSQLMENFMWDKDRLQSMSCHRDSGEQLPDELFEQIMKNKYDGIASWVLAQCKYALFDIRLHHIDGLTVQESWKYIYDNYRLGDDPIDYKFPGNFSHIFDGGYAAGYYGYMWADVLAADVYQAVKNSDDPKAKMKEFREKILSQGWDKDMDELFRDFMGRDPDPAALFEKYGITDSAETTDECYAE